MVGDSLSDMQAGVRAGVATLVHVLTGYGAQERESVLRMQHSREPSKRYDGALLLVDSLAELDRAMLVRA